ncbi:MAG: DUF3298 domain-containing protein [Lysobacteraceae bacterium]|nr:MAG: DUF3298 domain-containing protein [Xanthomonadaceae bacterium]
MRFWPLALPVLLLAGCNKEMDSAPPAPPKTAPAPPQAELQPQPIELKDLIETDQRYVVGISYPPAASKYPGLAAELRRYADAARDELMKAVASIDASKQSSPYDLTLNFTLLTETPQMVAVAADGSSYTGGAHSAPLVARFVWLPRQNRVMSAESLLAEPQGWNVISDYVREQLHSTLSQRVDADELAAPERAEVMRGAARMIDEGTTPAAASFSSFEPVLAASDGKLMALRFVFPPYQVGPYVDGVRTVEVPASVLLPYLSPEYRSLFVGG